MSSFNIDRFLGKRGASAEYQRQLERLRVAGKHSGCIEDAVEGAAQNLRESKHSFVIYGEPQSGKTEMMICLTAKLVDEGYSFILHLLNDSVDLLGQNLGRFLGSGLAPAAKHFSDILDPSVQIKGHRHVVFCKKNGKDLARLLERIGKLHNIVVIDDEADYASPNAQVNKGVKTKINDLIAKLLENKGIYIGVTATPARLDLNNTFDNDSNHWVTFRPHPAYTGQDVFFPLDRETDKFRLTLVSDQGASPDFTRQALFGFLVNVAYLNKYVNNPEQNYSFLVHTSGKKVDHKADRHQIHDCMTELLERKSNTFKKYTESIWNLAKARYPGKEDRLTDYILDNIPRQKVLVLNSERDWKDNSTAATNPTALFTIIIGGNIVSRGVTFDNLLSMYFTRDVRHKIQQDTYIQRARMFGSRGSYLPYFELTIPRSLYSDWHRCFVFHRLALNAITDGLGSLVWLGDQRISAVSSSSIDRSTVDVNRGEMSFAIFNWDDRLDKILTGDGDVEKKFDLMVGIVGDKSFPHYLRKYIRVTSPSMNTSVALHNSSLITSNAADYNADNISRVKGLMGSSQLRASKFPDAIHHLRIFRNEKGKARLFYKLLGSIQMMHNTANDT